MYGLKSKKGILIKKPWTLATTSTTIGLMMCRQCDIVTTIHHVGDLSARGLSSTLPTLPPDSTKHF